MEIFIKNCNSLCFYDLCIIPDYNCTFKVPSKKGSAVVVSIDFENKKIEASNHYDISIDLLQYLRKIGNDDNSPEVNPLENEELSNIIYELEESTKKVISLLKYCLKIKGINDNHTFRARLFCFYDGNEWEIPNTADTWSDCYATVPLDVASAKNIQEYLDHDFTPFLALKFLDRANNEENLQIKWIEVAAAIEIAMKEFLLKTDSVRYRRLKPKRGESKIKFYSEQIKEFTGEEFPMVDNFIDGAQIRNSIIHGPDEPTISHKKAINYVHDVDYAIHYMLSYLYPNDWLIRMSYDNSKLRPYTKEEIISKIKRDHPDKKGL